MRHNACTAVPVQGHGGKQSASTPASCGNQLGAVALRVYLLAEVADTLERVTTGTQARLAQSIWTLKFGKRLSLH